MSGRVVLILMLFAVFSGTAVLAQNDAVDNGIKLSRTCAGCHGTAGASPGEIIPVIGGQVEKYLLTALTEFALDKRPGDVMRNLAKGYDEGEQEKIAAFFSIQAWGNTPHTAESQATAGLVKSCSGCHGANGKGRGAMPRLAGQHPAYLYQALMEYKQSERQARTMALVKNVDRAILRQMADYYSSLK